MSLAALTFASAALAEDEDLTYRLTVINQAGETLSVVCNDSTPRPLGVGRAWTFNLVGPDRLRIACTGYDHHGEAIAYASIVLDHHHVVHTLRLRRSNHN